MTLTASSATSLLGDRWVLVVLTIVFIMGIDMGLLLLWAEADIGFPFVFILHVLASSLLLAVFLIPKTGYPWLALLSLPIVLVLGPIGTAGILLSVFLCVWYGRSATPFEVWYNEILPSQATPPTERLIERLRVWSQNPETQKNALVHFIDIMKSGSREEKQLAIDLMRKHYHPDFSLVLKNALNDSSNIVRSHAVATITKIEETFQARAYQLERRIKESPDDISNILELARHYDNHANSALSDVDLIDDYRNKAEKSYRYLLELQPNDEEVLWLLGRLLIRAKRMSEAADIFEVALRVSNNVVDPLRRIWYWECLYNLNRFTTLREEVHQHHHQIIGNANLPQGLLDSIELWTTDVANFGVMSK